MVAVTHRGSELAPTSAAKNLSQVYPGLMLDVGWLNTQDRLVAGTK